MLSTLPPGEFADSGHSGMRELTVRYPATFVALRGTGTGTGTAKFSPLSSGQLQVAPLMAKEAGTAFVVPFQPPLNPMPVKVAPAAILPL